MDRTAITQLLTMTEKPDENSTRPSYANIDLPLNDEDIASFPGSQKSPRGGKYLLSPYKTISPLKSLALDEQNENFGTYLAQDRNTADVLRSKVLQSPMSKRFPSPKKIPSLEEMEKIARKLSEEGKNLERNFKMKLNNAEMSKPKQNPPKKDFRHNEWKSLYAMFDEQPSPKPSLTYGEFEERVHSDQDNLKEKPKINENSDWHFPLKEASPNHLRTLSPVKRLNSLSPVNDYDSSNVRQKFNEFMDSKTTDNLYEDDNDISPFNITGLNRSKPENIPSVSRLAKNPFLRIKEDRYLKRRRSSSDYSHTSPPSIEMPPLVETPVRKSKRQESLRETNDYKTKDPLGDVKGSKKDYELRPQGIVIYEAQLDESESRAAKEIRQSTSNFNDKDEKEDNIRFRTKYDDLVGRTVKGCFDSGNQKEWFYGKIEYYNTQLKEYKITYSDESIDYIKRDDFGPDLKLVKDMDDSYLKRDRRIVKEEFPLEPSSSSSSKPVDLKRFLRKFRNSGDIEDNESGYETDSNTLNVSENFKLATRIGRPPTETSKSVHAEYKRGDVVWCKWWDKSWYAAKVIDLDDVPGQYYQELYQMYKTAKKFTYFIVRFYVDGSYSKVHKDKMEELRERKIDIARSKNNPKEYADAVADLKSM